MGKLKSYHKKRDFNATPEPRGRVSLKKNNLLFVIQKHAASHLHYDLRLELNGTLLSWAVPKGPSLDPNVKRLAIQVEDHPVEYGHFEGTIPKGQYGGGTVMLWDLGTWAMVKDKAPLAAYKKGHLHFELKAKKLHGEWALIRGKQADGKAWFLIKIKDKYARPMASYDILLKKPKSVLSGKDLQGIEAQHTTLLNNARSRKKKVTPAKKNNIDFKTYKLTRSKIPAVISPQLSVLIDQAPIGHEWLHEIKFDGYRIIAFKAYDHVRLMSRNNHEWTARFENIEKAIKKIFKKNIILDGEVVLLDEQNHSNFQLLQNSIDLEKEAPFIYYIFDLLYYDQYNLMSLPLLERKKILRQLLPKNHLVLRFSDHIIGNGAEFFEQACKMSLEGTIAKKIHSPYVEARTKNWLKLKCTHTQEFVVGGFSPPQGSRKYFGALYLGFYTHKGQFKYCGRVGTGFNQQTLKMLAGRLKKYVQKTNPFDVVPPGVTTVVWVKPHWVVEVEFTEWTQDGHLRHPSFKGLRSDKPAKKVHRERAMKAPVGKDTQAVKPLPVKLTHPDKVLYPEDHITKWAIAHFYNHIQQWILPFIINRPLTLVRCPVNYKDQFYQKHINQSSSKGLYEIKVRGKNKIEKYFYIKDIKGLLELIQMSTLEIHVWGANIKNIDCPDMITFDIDPAPSVPWEKVVRAAQLIKAHLADYHLKSYVKTTGGKGLHVVAPIRPQHDWKTIKEFSYEFVKYLVAKYPEEYVSEMSKKKRKNKIFIDYLRNQKGATSVSAYSLRARQGAPVSVPLAWDELTEHYQDTFYTLKDLAERLGRLQKNPWKNFFNGATLKMGPKK